MEWQQERIWGKKSFWFGLNYFRMEKITACLNPNENDPFERKKTEYREERAVARVVLSRQEGIKSSVSVECI